MASASRTPANQSTTVAYFSMEVGLDPSMPTYSGGLGVLAEDTIRSAADLSIAMVAVTLLHRKGYFYKRLDTNGWQREEPMEWAVDDFSEEMPQRTSVTIEGRAVQIRAWKYEVMGIDGDKVSVYSLDGNLPETSEWEALLAVRFIFTFHFFHTHLHPESFPLDRLIFTGKVTSERFIEERPEEYE